MSAFCCFKPSAQITGQDANARNNRNIIRKSNNELDLLSQQKAMGQEFNMGMGMGLSFED
jgi:hypothetical protein